MVTCEACNREGEDGKAFCTFCGARLPGTPAPQAPPAATECLAWSRKIPLITNPYLVLQCIAIPLGIATVMGGILSLVVGSTDMLVLFLVICAGLSVLMLIITAVLHLVTGGGLETEFFISDEGVAHKAGGTTRSLDRASAVGSAVLGSMGGTGAGLLAMSQECNVLFWNDVRYVSVYPSMKSMVFRSRYLISPVVLYCTGENFSTVLAMVRKYAPGPALRNI